MPCFRGIDVSIAAVAEARMSFKLPEFPHPDGSSVRLYTSSPRKLGSSAVPSPGRLPACSEDGRARNPRPEISVYIPSMPGSSFFFEYAITNAPSGYRYLFFKVFMNGRHIVSWGIDLRTVASGTMYRALYEPSEHCQHREKGVLVSSPGTEGRSFRFVSGSGPRSVADDGGLIEFQAFRAKARSGRAARLDQHRSQDKYGIAILSDGLLDKPEETTYYDYHLADPKDAPYASFRFHYRSSDNLEQLQLVPSRTSRFSPSFSVSSASSWIKTSSDSGVIPEEAEDQGFSFGFAARKQQATVALDGQHDGADHRSSHPLQSAPNLQPRSRPAVEVPQPCKVIRDVLSDSYLQRPLPDLPPPDEPEPPRTPYTSPHSRTSSMRSLASIAPSLLSKLSCESFSGSSGGYGVATRAEVAHEGRAQLCDIPAKDPKTALPRQTRTANGDSQADHSISNYTPSPPSSEDSIRPSLPSPGHYFATTGSQLEQHLAAFQSPARGSPRDTPSDMVSLSPKMRRILGEYADSELDLPRVGTLDLTEHEWLMGGRGVDGHGLSAHVQEMSRGTWGSPPPSGLRRSTKASRVVANRDMGNRNHPVCDGEGGGNWI